MSAIMWLVRFGWNALRRIKRTIILAGYSDKSVAAYFRRQGAQIGQGCNLCVDTLGTEPYLVNIGNHVFVSKGVFFQTHDGGVWILRDQAPGIRVHGPIIVEDNCIIGVNAVLMPNIRIGRNSIVGAGSVVISDVPPNSIVMGVPARVISSYPKYEEKCLARWQEQCPPDLDLSGKHEWWFYRRNVRKMRKHLTKLFADRFKPGDEIEKPPEKG